jgi:hypothetical protein
MNAIYLIPFSFLATLTITSFQKARALKDFSSIIKGKVVEVTSTDEGVFLNVEYVAEENVKIQTEKESPITLVELKKEIYKHRFSPVKLPEKKLETLIIKYLDRNFYLLGKKENGKFIEVTAYANVKLVKWIYLLGSLAVGYALFA